LGDPGLVSDSLFFEALLFSRFSTPATFIVGFASNKRAAAPATCGHAMEVPLIVACPVLLLWPADVILDPGPNMSKQLP